MTHLLQIALLLALVAGAVFLCFHAVMAAKKSTVDTGVQIQCSSGDSEVMSFNLNFHKGESAEGKSEKIAEAFGFIQARRDQNHEAWLEKKAEAIEKNSKLSPEQLKMKRLEEQRTLEAVAAEAK